MHLQSQINAASSSRLRHTHKQFVGNSNTTARPFLRALFESCWIQDFAIRCNVKSCITIALLGKSSMWHKTSFAIPLSGKCQGWQVMIFQTQAALHTLCIPREVHESPWKQTTKTILLVYGPTEPPENTYQEPQTFKLHWNPAATFSAYCCTGSSCRKICWAKQVWKEAVRLTIYEHSTSERTSIVDCLFT